MQEDRALGADHVAASLPGGRIAYRVVMGMMGEHVAPAFSSGRRGSSPGMEISILLSGPGQNSLQCSFDAKRDVYPETAAEAREYARKRNVRLITTSYPSTGRRMLCLGHPHQSTAERKNPPCRCPAGQAFFSLLARQPGLPVEKRNALPEFPCALEVPEDRRIAVSEDEMVCTIAQVCHTDAVPPGGAGTHPLSPADGG